MNLCVGEGVFKFQVIFKSPLILLCSPVFACHPLSGKVLWIRMGAACPPDPLVAVIMGCAVLSCQSCRTLCDHVGCNPPGSFVQARLLVWAALPSPRGSSQTRSPALGRFYRLSSQRSPLGTWQFNLAVYDYFISLDLSDKYPVRLMVLLACLLLNHHRDNTDLLNPLPAAATKVPVFTACPGHAFMEGPDDRTQLQIGRKGNSLGKKKMPYICIVLSWRSLINVFFRNNHFLVCHIHLVKFQSAHEIVGSGYFVPLDSYFLAGGIVNLITPSQGKVRTLLCLFVLYDL